MDAVNLFHLATTQAKWLSLRQTAVANNIANAHMPSYKTMDVEPFESVLAGASVRLGGTSGSHFGVSSGEPAMSVSDQPVGGIANTGRTVSMEAELVKSAEIKHAFEMNTAIVSAFHRMILISAKNS